MQLPLRTKRFDEAQVLVQGPDCDGRRELIAVCTGTSAQQHADTIIRAVNAHDDLLEALKELHALVCGECPSTLEGDYRDEMVRAAIAKAEGREA